MVEMALKAAAAAGKASAVKAGRSSPCAADYFEAGLVFMETIGLAPFARPNLSPRERQILEMTAVGMTAKLIAVDLRIAPRTVERHLENTRLKLGARNRAHAIAIWRKW